MSTVDFLSDELIYALGWTVLHSLWQAAFIAIGLGLAQYFLQKRKAITRYNLSLTALLLVMGSACITFLIYFQNDRSTSDAFTFFFNENEVVNQRLLPSLSASFSFYFEEHLPLIVSVWIVGVLILVLRMLCGLAFLERLKYRQNHPLPEYWQSKMQALAAKIPVEQTVQLLESALVKVPMVIGNLKPIILLPMGAVNQLTMEQVEAILAHELAHIYRHDYLVNIFQSIIETLFYFNPAVWFISATIRTERENCCDDIAVELCGNSLTYAKALVSLQELNHSAPRFAMAFSNKRNQLLNRVKRLLNQPQNKSNIMEKLIVSSLVLVAFVLFTAAKSMGDIDQDTFESHLTMESDTIPASSKRVYENSSSKTTIKRRTDNKQINLQMEDGAISNLYIDGKKIDPKDYDEYQHIIDEVKNTPPPPPPPGNMPPPPPPPAPPIPNEGGSIDREVKVIRKKGEDGISRVFILDDESGKSTVVEIEEGGKIVINGDEVFDGDEIRIIEEIQISGGDFTIFDEELAFSGLNEADILTIQIDAMDQIDIQGIMDNIDSPDMDEEMKHELREQLRELKEEQQEHIEELREEMRERKMEIKERKYELREEIRERNEDVKEQHRELADHHREMQREIQERVRGANEEMHARMEESGYHIANGSRSELLSAIQSALQSEGLVGDKYNVVIDDKKMKINGSKQSQEVYERYRSIIKRYKPQQVNDKFDIKIKKSKTNTWISSSF